MSTTKAPRARAFVAVLNLEAGVSETMVNEMGHTVKL